MKRLFEREKRKKEKEKPQCGPTRSTYQQKISIGD